MQKIFICGGAGFIGGHFIQRFLTSPETKRVTVYDNFSTRAHWPLQDLHDSRLTLVRADIKELDVLTEVMRGHDTVLHLASNPDIARAAHEPTIDFDAGTLLTQMVVEAMRRSQTQTILYASGSGVYGETGSLEVAENYGPLLPISTYGASKLAGEGLISAYAHMFGLRGRAFRFGNVVGPGQTHGVGLDFIKKLKKNNHGLEILGDGSQSKSYVYISDIINAVLLADSKIDKPFEVFNVATGDYITVKEIALIAINKTLGAAAKVQLQFTGGDRGWKGDVPVVRLNTDKIKSLGWTCNHSSKQAIERSIEEMVAEQNLSSAGHMDATESGSSSVV